MDSGEKGMNPVPMAIIENIGQSPPALKSCMNYMIEYKKLWEKKKLLDTSNFSFSHNVFKSCLLLMRQNEYL